MGAALELKLSSNTSLVRTFSHQVQAYARASGAQTKLFVVIDLDEHVKPLEELVRAYQRSGDVFQRSTLYIIDGRNSPPASKIKNSRKPLPQPDVSASISPRPRQRSNAPTSQAPAKLRTTAMQAIPPRRATVALARQKTTVEILAEMFAKLEKRLDERDRR